MDEVSIFATFQMTADAALGNFLATGVVFFTLKNAAGDLVVPTTRPTAFFCADRADA